MTRELRVGLGVLAGLGALIAFLLVVGGMGGPRPELDRLTVAEVLAGGAPADRFGSGELRIVGWYAELAADCDGSDGSASGEAAWLARDCPLRVLLPEQPPEDVTQAMLEADGLRISAPTNAVFPSRAEPGGPNLRLQQLVFVGRFDDPAAAGCASDLRERCRNVFVVTDYDGLLR